MRAPGCRLWGRPCSGWSGEPCARARLGSDSLPCGMGGECMMQDRGLQARPRNDCGCGPCVGLAQQAWGAEVGKHMKAGGAELLALLLPSCELCIHGWAHDQTVP